MAVSCSFQGRSLARSPPNKTGNPSPGWRELTYNEQHVEKGSYGWVDSTRWTFQGLGDSGKISFAFVVGGADSTDFVDVTSATDVLDGTFHHVDGTWDRSKIRLYVDRTLQALELS